MAKSSSYDRGYYERKRKLLLRKSAAYYKKNRTKRLQYQKRYRMKTKAGTKNYRPLYSRGARGGKRPLYARLPRLNAYRFIGRKRGKQSHALGRKAPSFRKGRGSHAGIKPMKGGRSAFKR